MMYKASLVQILIFFIFPLLHYTQPIPIALKERLSVYNLAINVNSVTKNATHKGYMYGESMAVSLLLHLLTDIEKRITMNEGDWEKVHLRDNQLLFDNCDDDLSILSPLMVFRSARRSIFYCGGNNKDMRLTESVRISLKRLGYHYKLRIGNYTKMNIELDCKNKYVFMQLRDVDPYSHELQMEAKQLINTGLLQLTNLVFHDHNSDLDEFICNNITDLTVPIVRSRGKLFMVRSTMHERLYALLQTRQFQHWFIRNDAGYKLCNKQWSILDVNKQIFDTYYESTIYADMESLLAFELVFLEEYRTANNLSKIENELLPCKDLHEISLSQTLDLNWSLPNPTSKHLKLASQTCSLDKLDRVRVLAGLQNRNIVFFGDSLTRYQYINLVYFLRTGQWAAAFPANVCEHDWPTWNAFFKGTNARLLGYEVCDCDREGPVTLGFRENRYYYDPMHNISISFINFFGSFTLMRYYEMPALFSMPCNASKKMESPGCPAFRYRHKLNNSCDSNLRGKMPLDVGGGIQSLLQLLKPDTVIINSGLWTNFTTARSKQLARLVQNHRSQFGAVFVWKTTTATKLDAKHQILDQGPREVFPSFGWKIFDTYKITKSLVSYDIWEAKTKLPSNITAMWDQRHFYDWVYKGLNEVLLTDLLRYVPFIAAATTTSSYLAIEKKERRRLETIIGSPSIFITKSLYWLIMHYHKTGHDISRAIFEPISQALNVKFADNLGPRRSLWKLDDYIGPGKLGHIPYLYSNINVQGGAEMHFEWNKYIKNNYKVLHFVRDPFDYIVSAYLYHAQVPPPPERFVRQRHYNPCAFSSVKLDVYVSELVFFGYNETFLYHALNETLNLCRKLHVKGPSFHKELHRLSLVDDNDYKAYQLEACRSIIADEIDAGGDLLRMVVNALRAKQAGPFRARQVFLNEFSLKNQTKWIECMKDTLQFLFQTPDLLSDLPTIEITKQIAENLTSIAFSRAFLTNTADVRNKIVNTGLHVTTDLITAEKRSKYIHMLENDEVLGPLLTLFQTILRV